MKPRQFVSQVSEAFAAHRNPRVAEPMARYMKNVAPFMGLPRPAFQSLMRPLWPVVKPHCTEAFLQSSARALWKLPEREFQYAAVEMLRRHRRQLTPASLSVIEKLLTAKPWWDTVDALAGHVLGPLVLRHRNLQIEMDRWSIHPSFWLRRAAILHQLGFKSETDARRLFDYCARNAADREFFIRKAIGWALRQHARIDTAAVHEFVKTHPELSALSRREALKHIGSAG